MSLSVPVFVFAGAALGARAVKQADLGRGGLVLRSALAATVLGVGAWSLVPSAHADFPAPHTMARVMVRASDNMKQKNVNDFLLFPR